MRSGVVVLLILSFLAVPTAALGTPLSFVNQPGALTTVLNYDPWGVRLQTLDAGLLSGALPFPTATSGLTPTHTFTGEPTMGGLTDDGLVYLRARWYDPTLGRFLTRDPVVEDDAPATSTREVLQDTEPQLFHRDDRNPQGLHPYVYVQNNPVRFIDPTGEAVWGVVARAAAGAIRAGAAAAARWVSKNVRFEGPKPVSPGQPRPQIFEVTIKGRPILTAEGPSPTSLWQVRVFDRALIVRSDSAPKPHVNVEVFGKNIHIPHCK